MPSLKHAFQIIGVIIIALFVVACGNNSTSGSGGNGGTTPTTPASSPIVKTASVTVKGQAETVLTNVQGMTLYYFTSDSATKAACTGGCAGIWPPLLLPGTGTPTSASSLPGTLSAVTDANGQQIEYNGHPLYLYSKDTAPGQANGEGLFGKWFVATPTLSSTSAPQSTPTQYGYQRA